MSVKSPLWKQIGKEDTPKSPQSSLSFAARPLKPCHIMLDDKSGFSSEAEGDPLPEQPSQKMPEHSSGGELDGFPMIITEDCERPPNEEVMEIISFDSNQNEKVGNMDNILKNMAQMQEIAKHRPMPSEAEKRQVDLRMKKVVQHMVGIVGNVQQLRQELCSYRFYLLGALSEWEVQAINDFKAMKQQIDTCMTINASRQEEEEGKYRNLQKQVAMLNRLALEREARELQERQKDELQQKRKRLERTQNEHRSKPAIEHYLLQQLKERNKKLQYQASQAKIQAESQTTKVTKLKEVIRDRQVTIASLHQQTIQLDNKIKELKFTIDEGASRERKFELEAKGYRDRWERERQAWEKETSRAKAEQGKLKSLLKVSEQQLSQCEDYISSLNAQIKQQQIDLTKLQQKLHNNELQYCKRLKECDSYLSQLESTIQHQVAVQQQRQQEYEYRHAELSRMKEEYQNKVIELSSKERQLQDLKRDYQHKILTLSRREDGMKAEYKMAIDIQNAAKDKWYQRYYTMLSPERHNRNEQLPHRDTNINLLSGRSSFARKETAEIRQTRSPLRQKLFRVKSERNINDICSTVSSTRNELGRCESHRDLGSLGTRITSLRRELNRELGQIGFKS